MKKDDKKILKKTIKYTFIFLFVIFLTLYFSMISGYYEYINHEKMVLTEEQIKKFESDVSAGKNIDLENYITPTNKNYQNGISKLGLNISNLVSKGVNNGVEQFFNFLMKLVDE